MGTAADGGALARAARLVKIISLVYQRRAAGERVGRQELGDACGCVVKTIGRDLDLLREIAPIIWEPSEQSYVWSDQRWHFPVAPLTAQDVLSLTLARGLLSAPGVPERAAMRQTFDRLLEGLPKAIGALRDEAGQTASFSSLPRDYSAAPVGTLMDAARERRAVEIDYESRSGSLPDAPAGARRSWRRVEPYGVDARDGIYWELYAWCPQNGAIRTFALDRIFEVRRLPDTFVRLEDVWEAFLQQQAASVGGIVGGIEAAAFTVEVIFDAPVAAYARDHRWSATLRIEDVATDTSAPPGDSMSPGVVRLRGTVPNCQAMVAELLRWRRHAHVLGGPELRAAYRDELTAMCAAHSD